jgi:hypothetical protein
MMSMLRRERNVSVLLRGGVGRWRSRVQAEEMEPLFQLCKDGGEVCQGSHLVREVFQQDFEVRDIIGLLLGPFGLVAA